MTWLSTRLRKLEYALLVLLLLTSALIVVLAVVGAVINYSPVPFWDMWNGYLEFYQKISNGDISSLWAQHNEHRIVVSRLLFWLDLGLLRGIGGFLIVVNYVCVLVGFAVFIKWYAEISAQSVNMKPTLAVYAVIAGLLFFWCQNNNLTWGFQSQFFLAQLLPLCAFYLCYKTHVSKYPLVTFLFACCLGVASAGTMANGIMALPLMLLYALVTRLDGRKTAALALLSVITCSLYFINYKAIVGHGSMVRSIVDHPVDLFYFVLLYIGSPFHYIIGNENRVIPAVAGLLMIMSAAYFMVTCLRNRSVEHLRLALLFFILYVGATAFGTAGGRLLFGLESAFSSRYTTPAIMAWITLLLLCAPRINLIIEKYKISSYAAMLLLLCSLLPEQMKALDSENDRLFNDDVAALALAMQVNDELQIGVIFPYSKWALSIAQDSVQRRVSVFGLSYMKDLQRSINGTAAYSTLSKCLGHIDNAASFDQNGFVRVNGWIFNSVVQHVPKKITFLNLDGKIIGYALSGGSRRDVETVISKSALQSGFRGYIRSDVAGQAVRLLGDDNTCYLDDRVPLTAYTLTREGKQSKMNLATVTQVKNLDDYKILSLSSGYSTLKLEGRSAVKLSLRRGQSILFRASQMMSNLSVSLPLGPAYLKSLPLASDWVRLTFDNSELPDDFDIEIDNDGVAGDQWAEISLATP
ncbi:hypothetical protein QN391_07155 [Pseudomonas sp. CCI1.2]|uniref:hypothetical protein n=1 Tax=Pseudomonas sp. CCI1.2 TaxID=3048614 RepID=UPI002B224D65|nr:hypothetical protein [Pseudomonas sp. CCI1.2]MEB0120484.1 hypothetical protein [Pseudomonas sp. CCI1.2]